MAETVGLSVQGGATAIILREKDLPFEERRELGEELLPILRSAAATLIVASDVTLAQALGTDWVHLAAHDPTLRQTDLCWGRSCHRLDDVRQAWHHGATYITLSPIFATSSKPGYGPELGIDGLTALSAEARPPVYALGGIVPGRARACLEAGAYGVAVMGAVMGAEDPRTVTAALVSELDSEGTIG